MNANDPIVMLAIFYGGLGLFVVAGALYCLRLIRRARRQREAQPMPLHEDISSGTITIPPGTRFANVRQLSPIASDIAHRA